MPFWEFVLHVCRLGHRDRKHHGDAQAHENVDDLFSQAVRVVPASEQTQRLRAAPRARGCGRVGPGEINRLARYEEIELLANGLSNTFHTEDFRINTIFAWQTNRYIDYPQLEVYNFH